MASCRARHGSRPDRPGGAGLVRIDRRPRRSAHRPRPAVHPLVCRARHDVRPAETRLLALRHGPVGRRSHDVARRPPTPPHRWDHLMKLANHGGRATLVVDGSIADVYDASAGRFGPDVMSVYDDWAAFVEFAAGVTAGTAPLIESQLLSPVPSPRQVFAIGLNYRSHAEESGMAIPSVPATFTKFPASLAGPFDDIEIVGGTVD